MNSIIRLAMGVVIICVLFAAASSSPHLINAQDNTTPEATTAATPVDIDNLPKADPSAGTRTNPIPFGSVGHRISSDKTAAFDIAIAQVYLGADATKLMLAASAINSSPDAGTQYLLAYILFKYVSGPDGLNTFQPTDFTVLANNRYYGNGGFGTFFLPSPAFSFSLYAPAKAEGWIAKTISDKATDPLLIWGADQNGAGGMYFSLTTPAEVATAVPTP